MRTQRPDGLELARTTSDHHPGGIGAAERGAHLPAVHPLAPKPRRARGLTVDSRSVTELHKFGPSLAQCAAHEPQQQQQQRAADIDGLLHRVSGRLDHRPGAATTGQRGHERAPSRTPRARMQGSCRGSVAARISPGVRPRRARPPGCETGSAQLIDEHARRIEAALMAPKHAGSTSNRSLATA